MKFDVLYYILFKGRNVYKTERKRMYSHGMETKIDPWQEAEKTLS